MTTGRHSSRLVFRVRGIEAHRPTIRNGTKRHLGHGSIRSEIDLATSEAGNTPVHLPLYDASI
jgi:hypothetical protein